MSATNATDIKAAPCDDHVQRQRWQEAVHVLEPAALDFATTLENFEVQFDHPTLLVVVNDLFNLSLRLDR